MVGTDGAVGAVGGDGTVGAAGVVGADLDVEDLSQEAADTAENEAAAESDIPALEANSEAPPVGNTHLPTDRNDFGCPLDFLATVSIGL